jgi:hypothetical protein
VRAEITVEADSFEVAELYNAIEGTADASASIRPSLARPLPFLTRSAVCHPVKLFQATEQPIDTSDAAGKAFLDMLGVFAEFETNLRRERKLEGIANWKPWPDGKAVFALEDEAVRLVVVLEGPKGVSEAVIRQSFGSARLLISVRRGRRGHRRRG